MSNSTEHPDDSPLIKKIRALLRQAESTTHSEEANAFMAKAQKLMVENGIQSVSTAYTDGPRKLEITEVWHKTGRQKYETDPYIASILRDCFSVRIIWSYDYELVKGWRGGKDAKKEERMERDTWKKRLIYGVVGDKEDVAIAFMVIEELHPIMRHMFRQYLKQSGHTWNAVSQHSFLEGFQMAYCEKNRVLKREALQASSEQTRDAFALAVADKAKATDDYIKQNIRTVRARSSGPRDKNDFDPAAFTTGKEKGSTFKAGTRKLK